MLSKSLLLIMDIFPLQKENKICKKKWHNDQSACCVHLKTKNKTNILTYIYKYTDCVLFTQSFL